MATTKKTKFRALKHNGDDAYSWAVFRADEVKGERSPYFGRARPIVNGLDRHEAQRLARDWSKAGKVGG